ncbi:DUF4347 domain-containing protein [Leptolyngbya sp. 7M]|uniref:DUF4347 domain-containing protein n=1 Tax=Leptolyngbya sp. 7M TaxID=2812896 RepID=UPI001B8ACDBA|nr:DUF4347 domain-containing protein [Leptolyngbya sp. 7M]QYO63720.1 DUF4347 domain-containing protein [Leptolyngbya sp. 7M]
MLILQPSTPSVRSNQPCLVANSTQILAFVDATFVNHLPLIGSIDVGLEVVLLDANRDGIEQVTEVLLCHSCVRRLQIFAASTPGTVQIGSARLDLSTIEAYSHQFQTWQRILTPDASILLWGEVAMGTAGMALMGRLSQLTGAVVAVTGQPNHAPESDCSGSGDAATWSKWMDLLD